jgi:hypothetical protein
MLIINTVYVGNSSQLTRVIPDEPKGNFSGFAVNDNIKRLVCLDCGALVAAGQTALYKHLGQQHAQTTVPPGYRHKVVLAVKSMQDRLKAPPLLSNLPATSVPVQGVRLVAAWRCEGCKRLETGQEAMLAHLEGCDKFEVPHAQRVARPVVAQQLSATVTVQVVDAISEAHVVSLGTDPAVQDVERLLQPTGEGPMDGPRQSSGLIRVLGATVAADRRLRKLGAAQRVACQGREDFNNFAKLQNATQRYMIGVGLHVYELNRGLRVCILDPQAHPHGHSGGARGGRAFAALQDLSSYREYSGHVAAFFWTMLRLPEAEWTGGWERLLPYVKRLREAFRQVRLGGVT